MARRWSRGDREAQAEAILRACAFKAAVVGDDEREDRPTTAAPCSISATRSAMRWRPRSATAAACCMARRSRSVSAWRFRLSARLGPVRPGGRDRVSDHLESVGLPSGTRHAEPAASPRTS